MQSNNQGGILIDGDPCYVSVSKILQSDPKRKTYYKSIGAKRKQDFKDGDAAVTGRHRGTSLHETFSQYITTGECDIAPIYLDYWQHLYDFIKPLKIVPSWAEVPLLPQHQHFTQGDTSCIWSKKGKWLGKPDLIARIEGCNAVVEIKTSNHPYSKSFDTRQFLRYSEFFSYAYAAMQCSAYKQCWEERTGESIDVGIVLNVMSDGLQMFVIEYPELKLRLKNFRALASEYHKSH